MTRPTPGAGEPQLAALRHQVILETLVEHGQVSANRLAEQLGLTHETVRNSARMKSRDAMIERKRSGLPE